VTGSLAETQVEPDGRLPSLRVALFADSNGPGYNGVTIAVRQLKNALRECGHDVAFVAPRSLDSARPGREAERLEFPLPSFHVPGIHPAIASGLGFRRCIRRLVHAKVDVVHIHGVGPVGLLGIHLAKRENLPLVMTWHTDISSYVRYYPMLRPFVPLWLRLVMRLCAGSRGLGDADEVVLEGTKNRKYQRSLIEGMRYLLQAADLVTSPSDKVAGQLKLLDVDTPIRTVPAGVNALTVETTQLLPSSGKRLSSPQLLYVGRISPEKGIDLLLDAFILVKDALPRATLRLVGDSSKSRSLHTRLRRVSRDPSVILTGEVDPAQLSGYYNQADIFVFPSTTDTQALVLHEAAHAGLPIISVDAQLSAVVANGKNALLSEPSAQALSEAILTMSELCSDPGYLQQAAKTGKELARKYSGERQVSELIKLYRLVTAAARSREGDR
jgi:1,2-diacylglycerol 3-alpha-glucosyltransferase